MPDADVEQFLTYAGTYLDINALTEGYEQRFAEDMTREPVTPSHQSFRRGFAKAILGQVTSADYEKATGWDFDSQEEFTEHLRHLWHLLYGDADPAA